MVNSFYLFKVTVKSCFIARRLKVTRMAQSCPSSNISSLSSEVSCICHEIDQSRQDCSSPSPTETLCVDALYGDSVAGKLFIFTTHFCNINNNHYNLGTSQSLYEKVEDSLNTQKVFFNDLSLEECDEENGQESCEEGTEGDCELDEVNQILLCYLFTTRLLIVIIFQQADDGSADEQDSCSSSRTSASTSNRYWVSYTSFKLFYSSIHN